MFDEKRSAKLLLAALLLGGVALVLGSCNTVRGVGEDITSGANAVDEAFAGDVDD